MEKMIVLMDLMSKDAVSIDDLHKVKECFLVYCYKFHQKNKNYYIPDLL